MPVGIVYIVYVAQVGLNIYWTTKPRTASINITVYNKDGRWWCVDCVSAISGRCQRAGGLLVHPVRGCHSGAHYLLLLICCAQA